MQQQDLEFTIEPFVEGNPGPYVRAAIDAVQALGVGVEIGPFGSACRTTPDTMPDVVAAILREAFANGATHVSLHVSTSAPASGDVRTVG